MRTITGRTADAVWRAAARRLKAGRGVRRQESRGGPTRELLHVGMTIRNPRERWVLSRQPPINPAFALAEVVWILNGRDDAEFLNFWNPLLPRFAGPGPTYYGAYGRRLRRRFRMDQIRRGYEALRAKPDTRQVVLQIWDPRTDLPAADGTPASEDVPCNISSLLKVRDGRLEWTQIMRSNDLVLGVPHNFVQFTSLQELFAGWLGLEPGPYTHVSDSLHVYEERLQALTPTRQTHWPRNTDRWTLGYRETSSCFHELADRMDSMRNARSGRAIAAAAEGRGLCTAAQNLLRTVGADAARRLRSMRQQWRS